MREPVERGIEILRKGENPVISCLKRLADGATARDIKAT